MSPHPTANTPQLFLFDIAGTTVQDDGWVMQAFLDTARAMSLAPEPEWIRARMGWSKRQVFEEMLSMHRLDPSLAPVMVDQFSSNVLGQIDRRPPTPLPGADAAIRALRAAHVKIGFTTGFAGSLAREIIGRLEWSPDVVVGSDEVAAGRPAPDLIELGMSRTGITEARRVGVIGDTPADVQAGIAAGCGWVLGVSHGSHTRAELTIPGCHAVLDSLVTLPEVLGVAR